jgi:phenylacetate-CoA ligase
MYNELYLLHKILRLRLNERKSREQILEIREKKFRKLISHAFRNSKFYNDLYSRAGISKEILSTITIEKIPCIDKKILMNNFNDIVTKKDLKKDDIIRFIETNKNPLDLYKNKYQIVNSSGSSGNIGIYVYSMLEYIEAFSCSTRMDLFKFGKRNKVAYYAGVDDRFGGVSLVLHGKRGLLKKFYDICLLDMNLPLEKIIEDLNEFNPSILIGYGSGLAILAKAQNDGRLRIKPDIIENGGEGLKDGDFRLISETFNAPIVNMYASVECYHLGIGKDAYDGIYLMDDFNYIEIMDDHILVTNLYNYTQPIIRFRIDDRLIEKEDKRNILPFRLVDNIIGRDEMMIWFVNDKGRKDFIQPLIFTDFFVKGLERFHINLKSESTFEFLAIFNNDEEKVNVTRNIDSRLKEILFKKEMSGVKYVIKEIKEPIIDKKSRKFRMVLKDY